MTGSDLVVDGHRPAVTLVAALPRGTVTAGERLVLLALACDSFDGVDGAPGWQALAEWTGMHASSVREIVNRLCEPTEHRPALLRKRDNTGRHRATIEFLIPPQPAVQPAVQPAAEPADDTGTSLTLAQTKNKYGDGVAVADPVVDQVLAEVVAVLAIPRGRLPAEAAHRRQKWRDLRRRLRAELDAGRSPEDLVYALAGPLPVAPVATVLGLLLTRARAGEVRKMLPDVVSAVA